MRTIVVGHGYFGRVYRDHLDRHDKFTVVGVCDTDYHRLDLLTGQTVAATYDQIKDNVDHDAVVICTPPHEHADISIKALTDGKHVLCMKPGAMSRSEFSLVTDAARGGSSAYCIDFTGMNAPEYRNMVPSPHGWITSISSSRHVAGGPKPEGIILDLLSHDIAILDSALAYGFAAMQNHKISVSCVMLNPVTAALTVNDAEGQRLMYANASYNATFPKKELMLKVKPDSGISNPLITTTWNQNHRFITIETQGRSIEIHYRHDPDPITRSLDRFYYDCVDSWGGPGSYDGIWDIIHAAIHSSQHDGMLIEVEW